jgi:hypothetical protein
MILKPFKVHSPDGKSFYEGEAAEMTQSPAPASPSGEDAAEQADEAVTRDAERYRWMRDFNVRCKDGVNNNPPCEHVHASM